MKVLQLDIEGFRSLKKVSWKPGDLNVIIDPNGSGKSNLLRFLELMSVSAQGRLGKYIQSLGGMEPIVWDRQTTTISFKLRRPLGENDLMSYLLEFVRLGTSSSYRIQREFLADFYPVEAVPIRFGTLESLSRYTGTSGCNHSSGRCCTVGKDNCSTWSKSYSRFAHSLYRRP